MKYYERMDGLMKNAKTFFDEYAHDFDALYGVPKNLLNFIVNPVFRKSMKLRFKKTLHYSHPIAGKSFFDIGCGPGHYAIALAKAGARKVAGIDFSAEMIKIAERRAFQENVAHICEFHVADIMDFQIQQQFDHSILMGFMDYIKEPERIINIALQVTDRSIFISFPIENGLLALQRKLRYKNRCPLFMYTSEDLKKLGVKFDNCTIAVEKISRDYFVTLSKQDQPINE
jgi:2-polyprenyl-3-methyl-5-hydroxy-6-metoxy-1,4-benzoquinol methylase